MSQNSAVHNARPNEPDIDDTAYCCPDCERPNQFGELCESCRIEQEHEARACDATDRD